MQANITEYASSYAIHKARGYQAAQLRCLMHICKSTHPKYEMCRLLTWTLFTPGLFHSNIRKTISGLTYMVSSDIY